ncbi:MAG: hypothetical protein R3272_05205 [Candidatus Promineifilaceae bacterium]|nr:hypothetical protein [Candidatus Promineifilaceae bacterium]
MTTEARLPVAHHPAVWAAGALALYLVAAGGTWNEQSLAPHYVHLADALLHGQLELIDPTSEYDLLVTDGRAYVAGSPLPAVLLMPAVFLFGNQFSDILFSIVVGALNVGLVQALFRRPWLTILFALGTPHLYMAALGSVWLTAHLVALFFALLALMAGWRHERMLLAGLLLGLAGLARPSVWFGIFFFVLFIWLRKRGRARWRALALLGVPFTAGVALHLLYNLARFGGGLAGLLNFGYQYTAGAPNIIAAYARYGGFHPRFLPCNLYVSLLNPPILFGAAPPLLQSVCSYLLPGGSTTAPGLIVPNPLGMSLLLTTPAFLLLAGPALLAVRRKSPLLLSGWVGLLAIMLPLWAYHNTGSLQFGYRYWMDAAPFWLLLLAVAYPPSASATAEVTDGPTEAAKARPSTRLYPLLERLRLPLVALSCVINFWGFIWIYGHFTGRAWLGSWLAWLQAILS